jgi:DNA ligase-1
MILKDLRANLGVTLTNKVWPGLIPDPPYMRCSLENEAKLDTWPWEQGIISEEKADGMFVNVDVTESVSITTRAGNELDTAEFPDICDVVTMFVEDAARLTGELLVVGPDGVVLDRATGNGILNHVQKGGQIPEGHHPILQVWDSIPLEFVKSGGQCLTPYAQRFMPIVRRLGVSDGKKYVSAIPYRIVRSLLEARQHYYELVGKGKEGTVICHPEAPWFDGTSRFKVKMKMAADCDLRIKGFTAGKGKNAKTFGAVECESECGQLKVNVSGFDDATRLDMHNRRAELLDTVMTVTSNGIQKSRSKSTLSLFLPVFSELRPDKNQADDLDRIRAIFASAMKGEEVAA